MGHLVLVKRESTSRPADRISWSPGVRTLGTSAPEASVPPSVVVDDVALRIPEEELSVLAALRAGKLHHVGPNCPAQFAVRTLGPDVSDAARTAIEFLPRLRRWLTCWTATVSTSWPVSWRSSSG